MPDFSALGKLGGRPQRPLYYILTEEDVLQPGDEYFNFDQDGWCVVQKNSIGGRAFGHIIYRRKVRRSRVLYSLGIRQKEAA